MQPLFHVEWANAGLTAAYRPLLSVASKSVLCTAAVSFEKPNG